ncbi:hypothetical protein BDV38DRAFT_289629 [Aspergillus pseudotamarii]|uniref:Rhodopsin domain-containing protein n=1 Tax=Aspergillus pseudotamarii TaxID=132259 RepID=A0A5N6TBW1_ASPPS|nr:uncharacterized protein BDV38DRAFT_289629 [Aspergillus pseudotamarii]KAE8143757.1 hypothetical protein BDV38DRAFT_289629 [Aspergillus pseudotamarii]
MATFDTNVDFSESRAVELNVVGWVFTGVAIAAVFLKVFSRMESKRAGWDDVLIFFSLGLSIIATAFVSYSVTLGLGRHTAAVIAEHGMERYVKTAYWQILGFPFNIGAFSFPNISIAILIVHLLDPNPLRARLLYAMVIFQVILAMISVFIVFFQCNPTEMLWDHSVKGSCWSPDVFDDFSYLVSAYTTVTDFVLAIVPIRALWKLQMQTSTKVGVCIMMGLTLLSAIVTIVKATYLHLFTDRTDPLFNVVPLVVWGLIEQNVVIVAACIPTLRPFFRKTFKPSKGSSGGADSRSRSGSAFKLGFIPSSSRSRTPFTSSDLPLTNSKGEADGDVESNSSRQGIWRTTEVRVES